MEINGLKYSKESFDDYKFRAKVKLTTNNTEHFIDVYTTDTEKSNVEYVLFLKSSTSVISTQITNWISREEDDAWKDFLLNGWE